MEKIKTKTIQNLPLFQRSEKEMKTINQALFQALGGGCRQGWSGGADKVNGAKNGGTKVNETLTTILSRYSYDAKDWVEVKDHGKDNDRDDVKVGHLGRCLVPQPTCFFSSQMGTLTRR